MRDASDASRGSVTDVGVAVVRRHGAVGDEVAAPLLEGGDVAGVAAGVDAGGGPERRRAPASRGGRLQVAIGPEGRDHPPGPGRVGAQGGVRGEVAAGSSVVASTSMPNRS